MSEGPSKERQLCGPHKASGGEQRGRAARAKVLEAAENLVSFRNRQEKRD